MFLQDLEILPGQLLRRDVRRPPLIGDERDIHRMKELVGRIRLSDDKGIAALHDAALQIGRVLPLVRQRIGGTA
jgi:hypothetical protein